MHRKYRVTHSASLSFGYVDALVSFTRTTIHVVPCAPPHRRPVFRLDQGFTAGLQARTPKRRHSRHEQASLAPTRLPAEKAATADGSCRHPPRGPEVQAEAWMIRRQAAGDVTPAAYTENNVSTEHCIRTLRQNTAIVRIGHVVRQKITISTEHCIRAKESNCTHRPCGTTAAFG
ncbi:hypothetical protein HPB50_001103 [Hyalomma asiaticum]|uniref:Uncharacterized protein n=1 Tax=Hyalomma asiaticum TaxID=266040 RepID=A0ACB7RWD4_HYAAI|nr:hypothetical protein HPB50_001103 [Hyalomma asiaticum]